MEFIGLVFSFMLLFMIGSVFFQFFPYLLIIWVVFAVLGWFRNRKVKKQMEQNFNSYYSNSQSSSSSRQQSVRTRKPKANSIDVEYIEYNDPDHEESIECRDSGEKDESTSQSQ